MKILVTGTPGSGKTSLTNYASNLEDQRFIDTDDVSNLCEWRNLKTGHVLGLVSDLTDPKDDNWYKTNGWYWKLPYLETLLEENPSIILCGSSENVTSSYKYFDKIFILEKTNEELLHNLQSPTRENPFGKTTQQRKDFINWQKYLIKEGSSYNTSIIRGNDIEQIYQKIISEIS